MIRSTSPAAATLVLAAAFGLAGCSINPALQVSGAMPGHGGEGSLLLAGVPFHPQTDYQCGPAALATVLGASDVAVSPEELAPRVYLPGRHGSLQVELLGATRRAGRIPYIVDGTPEALLAELRAGRPTLVLQNLWVRSLPRWHYAVLVGADPARNRLVFHSGDKRGLEMGAKAFLRTWDWAGRWGMVSLRPGELPANPDPARYLSAVADFEQVAGAKAAEPAYRAALAHWPRDPRPHLAVGNQAHAAKDAAAAVRHYRDGLRLAPHDPVIGNNLASVLGEQGCMVEARKALAAARDGLDAASPWRKTLDETARELDAAPRKRGRGCEALR